jgi:hypothetical protein
MMSNNVKVIHLDGQDFSIESDSDSTVDINEKKEVFVDASADAAVPPEAGGADKKSDDDDSDSCSECNTADLLASDPLYFILSRMFMTTDGKNVASILEEINVKLDKLLLSGGRT